jgi:hypothetical protein
VVLWYDILNRLHGRVESCRNNLTPVRRCGLNHPERTLKFLFYRQIEKSQSTFTSKFSPSRFPTIAGGQRQLR